MVPLSGHITTIPLMADSRCELFFRVYRIVHHAQLNLPIL